MRPTIDLGEATRFIGTGVLATAANLTAVISARAFATYPVALLAGVAAGMATSFLLSKLWAFRSTSWAAAGGEMRRFIVVYGFGLALYFVVAVISERLLQASGVATPASEVLGVLLGGAMMMVANYFGHKHFTFGRRLTVRSGR